MLFGALRIQKGRVYEGPIVQKSARSRMDVLLLSLSDYSCLVKAISLYDHEGGRRGVFDRKDQFDVPGALHDR